MNRVSVNYVEGEPYPYVVEVVMDGKPWSSVYYPTLEEAIRRARGLAKYYATEVWCFDGTLYDYDGKKWKPSK